MLGIVIALLLCGSLASATETLASAFAVPPGAVRATAEAWGESLRSLPLYPVDREVMSYRGDALAMPAARVVELPLVAGDLQQCADSILRLRAEWERKQGREPAYHYTSGYLSRWSDWKAGKRPVVSGSKVSLGGGGKTGDTEANWTGWLTNLFMYAGTRSLGRDTVAPPGAPVAGAQVGDLLVTPGSPGHAVLIVDVARGEGHTWVLVGQGFMPAQDFHVVRGPASGWFEVAGDTLPTAPIAMEWAGWRRFP